MRREEEDRVQAGEGRKGEDERGGEGMEGTRRMYL